MPTIIAPGAAGGNVRIQLEALTLPGLLAVPSGASGVVAFAHGSGSSRLSPRNARVAEVLQRAGTGTLLFDLLTKPEAEHRANVFHIEELARRLEATVRWLRGRPETAPLPVGLFGASTGAAAALVAAARLPDLVRAVVSRGGRPELAGDWLAECPEVEWTANYAVLGPYDYLDVFTAPDVETASKVATMVRVFGQAHTETWAAVEWSRYKELVRQIPDGSIVAAEIA